MPGVGRGAETPDRRLNSWKEVATYFQRDERTVKRWETSRGLPIHRVPGQARSKIYAYTTELDAWLNASPDPPKADVKTQEPAPAAEAKAKPRLRLVYLVAIAGLAALFYSGWRWDAGNRIARAQSPASHDRQAMELYREGWHDWNTRTATGLNRAREEFSQALARDPKFAQAYVGLANTYLMLREYSGMPDAAAYPKAYAAVNQALALSPDLADAHSALGFIDYWWRWDPKSAEAELKRSIALAPGNVDTHLWLANIMKVQTRYKEALQQIDQAQALAPESSAVLEAKGNILMEMGQVEEGRKILVRLEEIEPDRMWPHAHLAKTALVDRQYPQYLDEYRKVIDLKGDAVGAAILGSVAGAVDRGGPKDVLGLILASQKAFAEKGQASAYDVACTYMLMGQPDPAVSWLHQAVAKHDANVLGFFSDPCMRPLWRDQRVEFLHRLVFGSAS